MIAISQSSFLKYWKDEIQSVMVSDFNPENDDLPKVDTTSEEYALGFDAGTEGRPCDGETREWRHGWADAHNKLPPHRVGHQNIYRRGTK